MDIYKDNIIDMLLKIVPNCFKNHHAEFAIERTYITCLNLRTKLLQTDGCRTKPTCKKNFIFKAKILKSRT